MAGCGDGGWSLYNRFINWLAWSAANRAVVDVTNWLESPHGVHTEWWMMFDAKFLWSTKRVGGRVASLFLRSLSSRLPLPNTSPLFSRWTKKKNSNSPIDSFFGSCGSTDMTRCTTHWKRRHQSTLTNLCLKLKFFKNYFNYRIK